MLFRSIIPSIDSVYDVGSPDYQINTVYARYFVGNGRGLTGIVATNAQALLVGRALTPVTVPLSTANSFNVLTVASGNVAVYTT